MLKLELNKKPEAQPRQIKINVGGQQKVEEPELAAVNRWRLAAVSYQLSAISCRLSAVGSQLSALRHRVGTPGAANAVLPACFCTKRRKRT